MKILFIIGGILVVGGLMILAAKIICFGGIRDD